MSSNSFILFAALPVGASLDEVTSFINQEKYSRIPVYEDSIDNIIGVMHSKYLIHYLSEGGNKENFNLRDIIRQPYFVPASKRTDELFKELQHNKTHLAIIIDEYGGTAGIVTLEDLLEEIVGNIFDEDDEEEKDIDKLDENTFIINGKDVRISPSKGVSIKNAVTVKKVKNPKVRGSKA